MYYNLYREGSQFRWNAKGDNHEIIASGESYHHKADCCHAMRLMNGLNHPVYDHTATNPFAFGLLAGAMAKHGISPPPVTGGLLSGMMQQTVNGGLLAGLSSTPPPQHNGMLALLARDGMNLSK
jgi:uncharacterized protein